LIVADPVPLVEPVTVSHVAFELAVHAHPAVSVSATEPLPPACVIVAAVGLRDAEHEASWLTVKLVFAIRIVPARGAPLFAATVYDTDPFPAPAPPAVIVIHGTFETAVQLHDAVALTVAEPEPPALPKLLLVGETP
jgi:hypothetical protein